ncbi:MAG: DUF885 domain-containing protein [Edaphocola sp.]
MNKMKSMTMAAIVALSVAACHNNGKGAATNTEATELDTLVAAYYKDWAALFPMEALSNGADARTDTLPNNLSADYAKTVTAVYTQYTERLKAIKRDQLDEAHKITYDVLHWECDMALETQKYPLELLPINQFWALSSTIAQMGSGGYVQPFKTTQDYENWLQRLSDFKVWSDTAVVKMREGIKKGWVLPKPLALKALPQLEALATGTAKDHLFYTPIKNLPDSIPAATKALLAQKYVATIDTLVIPIYKKLADFFRNEYIAAARTTSGIGDLPGGADLYRHLVKTYTTTNITPEEVFALGEKEVARLQGEMEKVKTELGFGGSLKDFFDTLRNSKKLMPFTRPEQVIAHFNNIHQRMKPRLKKLFELAPKTPFEVRRTETFREASASAEYNPGALKDGRAAIFYVPIPDAKKYNVLQDEDLFLHEAIPGHHYQIALTQENASLPGFRRTLWYSAYGEGWALYAESLGKELGLYTDPYQYFGMLSAEMHRAIRLVVDAGIHAKGWTREQAIQYSLEHEAEPEASVVAEIERYMAIPGQALSYKMGQLKIREMRALAEKELGDKFNIAAFHAAVLDEGCLPLKVFEDKMTRWLATEKMSH